MQTKSASETNGLSGSGRSVLDNGLLDLLQGKLAVLQFQIKIKEQLEAMASRLEASPGTSESVATETVSDGVQPVDNNFLLSLKEKANELSMDLKSITQLYNEYAVPFELWEVWKQPLQNSLFSPCRITFH